MNVLPVSGPESRCAATEGVFFLRRCGQPGTAHCSLCQVPLCTRHQRFQEDKMLCPACYADATRTAGSRLAGSTSAFRSRSGYPVGSDAFGGTGDEPAFVDSTGLWSADTDESPFSPEDYAAFDAISDFDKNEVGDGYDS